MIAFVLYLFGIYLSQPILGYVYDEYIPIEKDLDLLDILVTLLNCPNDLLENNIRNGRVSSENILPMEGDVRFGGKARASGTVSIVGKSGFGIEYPFHLQTGPNLPPVVMPYIIPVPSVVYPPVTVPSVTIPYVDSRYDYFFDEPRIPFSGIVPASGKVTITGTFGDGFQSYSNNKYSVPMFSPPPIQNFDYYTLTERDYNYLDNDYENMYNDEMNFSGIVPVSGRVVLAANFNDNMNNYYSPYIIPSVRKYDNILYRAHLLNNNHKKNKDVISMKNGRQFEGMVPARGRVRIAARF